MEEKNIDWNFINIFHSKLLVLMFLEDKFENSNIFVRVGQYRR